MTKIDFVTVVNDSEQYEKYFVKNNNVNKNNLVKYNNSTDNISITKRFNDYINNRMQDDTWVIFCHQDFEFREDINNILYSLDKNCIYGPVGASTISIAVVL
ncbi:MAG: hypothetical protein HZB41_11975 [Ignavibacteriae bacterium]|nr:hypothetical protein [Ignavibacteriota bacterium]